MANNATKTNLNTTSLGLAALVVLAGPLGWAPAWWLLATWAMGFIGITLFTGWRDFTTPDVARRWRRGVTEATNFHILWRNLATALMVGVIGPTGAGALAGVYAVAGLYHYLANEIAAGRGKPADA